MIFGFVAFCITINSTEFCILYTNPTSLVKSTKVTNLWSSWTKMLGSYKITPNRSNWFESRKGELSKKRKKMVVAGAI